MEATSLQLSLWIKDKEIFQPDYGQILKFGTFYKYFKKCCNSVRWKASTTEFESNLVAIVGEKLKLIQQQKYRASSFVNFQLNERGKIRNISALKISDRGVQKVINQEVLLPIFSPLFTESNCASIKGRGITQSVDIIIRQLKDHYQKYGTQGRVYLYDFKNYFGSIPREELKALIRETVKDPIIQKVLLDFVNDARKLPTASKDEEHHYRGIGLGSETSQTFALVYAMPIDNYVESLKEDNIPAVGGRYMDDGYVICSNLKHLEEIKNEINKIAKLIKLTVNPKKEKIIPLKGNGFTFLKLTFQLNDNGYISVTPCHANIARARRKINKMRRLVDCRAMTIEDACNSYNGIRNGLMRAKDSFATIYNLDIFFVNTFRKMLTYREKKLNTYLKTFKNKEGWVYITKPLNKGKMEKYSKKQQTKINQRFTGKTPEQLDRYFEKKQVKKGNIKLRNGANYDPRKMPKIGSVS